MDQKAADAPNRRETLERVPSSSGMSTGDEVAGWKLAEITKVPDSEDPVKFTLQFTKEIDGQTHRLAYNSSGPDISRTGVEAWLRRNESGADPEPDTPRWVT